MAKKRKKNTSKLPNKKPHATNHKRKKAGRKTPAKSQRKRVAKNGNVSGKTRQRNLSKKSKLPTKKSGRKTVHKNKVSIQTQRSSGGKKTTGKKSISRKGNTKKVSGTIQAKKSYFKNYSQIDFTFGKVRAVGKKIALFEAGAEKYIKDALSRKGGKPPRGIIVTVRDNKGREKTESSRFDFVVNLKNVLAYVRDMLERMKDDFMEWKDMEESGEPTDDLDVNPYGNYNPDNIMEITIKFIY